MSFDKNKFYRFQVKSKPGDQSITGTNLFKDGKSGAVFVKADSKSNPPERSWQVFPFNDTYHVLRQREGGPNAVLATLSNSEGETVPRMARTDVAGDSLFWMIAPRTGDEGYFTLQNAANGTGWSLMVKGNGLMAMDKSANAEEESFGFSFTESGDVNDERYSSILLDQPTPTTSQSSPTASQTESVTTSPATDNPSILSSTATSLTPSSAAAPADPANQTATPSISGTPSSFSSPSGGLSSSASAGVGAACAVIAIALLALAVYFIRKRRRQATVAMAPAELHSENGAWGRQQLDESKRFVEMEVSPVELPTKPATAELSATHEGAELPAGERRFAPVDERFVPRPGADT